MTFFFLCSFFSFGSLAQNLTSLNSTSDYLLGARLEKGSFSESFHSPRNRNSSKRVDLSTHFKIWYSLSLFQQMTKKHFPENAIKEGIIGELLSHYRIISPSTSGVVKDVKKGNTRLDDLALAIATIAISHSHLKTRFSKEKVRKLGNLLMKMQKKSGLFFYEYLSLKGRKDSLSDVANSSLASWGLLHLFSLTKNEDYLKGAMKGLDAVVKRSKQYLPSQIVSDFYFLRSLSYIFDKKIILGESIKVRLLNYSDLMMKNHSLEAPRSVSLLANQLIGYISYFPFIRAEELKKNVRERIESIAAKLKALQIHKGPLRGSFKWKGSDEVFVGGVSNSLLGLTLYYTSFKASISI